MCEDKLKWRFAHSNYGIRKGLNTGDAETFKSDPYANFAREVVQNSIDAQLDRDKPVTVEFHAFKINTCDIPGIDDLKSAVKRCIELWNDSNSEFSKVYDDILNKLNSRVIGCLRISDKNTVGLDGIERPDDWRDNKFLALTRSTGVSNKGNDTAGGSKGVGKNAAFLLSEVKTVFYSTLTFKGYKGGFGVADFISGYAEDSRADTESRDYTQGEGYFGRNDRNHPCEEFVRFDKDFHDREQGDSGTDIYILGFAQNEKWAYEIIESVLDSFMACIANNKLEIKINDQVINHDTLWSVISNQLYINPKKQPMFVAQYKLLKGDGDVRVFDIDTGYGVAKLSVLVLNDNDKRLATHKCAMIRYPYMKIKDFALQSNLNVAAMCIIENDKLCSTLRDLENPQHSNWEVKRANPQDRQAMRDLINSIKDQISDNVLSCFQAEAHDTIDPYGAGDYLAETNGEGSESNGNATVNGNQEEIEVTKPKEAIVIEKNAYIEQNDGAGVRPEIGQSDSDGDDTSRPGGHNEGSGGGYGEGDELGGSKDGDNIVMKKAQIAGVRYRVIALDKDKGKYRITFTAPDTYEACYISLYIVGDEFKQKDKLSIKNMKCNGVKIASDSEFEYGPFAMKTGQKVIAELETNQTEYFSCEVKIYATQK